MISDTDTRIAQLGPPQIDSPFLEHQHNTEVMFATDDQRVCIDLDPRQRTATAEPATLERAGPRRKIYFDPSKMRAALVTCGGLCPGVNAVIRAIVLELHYGYGAEQIFGIRFGLQGFIPKYKRDMRVLTPAAVGDIMTKGGSILGSSRGPQEIGEIVDCLERANISVLFVIGGDGTLKAALRIAETVHRRNLKISVVGVPKTIDNDIFMVSRSFGFDTAVDIATQAVAAAHNEATGFPNGLGLIKLMGRHSGFIAATTALAMPDVNMVLIPEVDFDLDGPGGLLAALDKRIEERGHAVILAAEGAGQKFFDGDGAASDTDASGNVRLGDIGGYLKERIEAHFRSRQIDITLKYIDPSYIIRSLPANASDQVFCNFLGRNAVHAALAGKTEVLVSHWNDAFVHVPMQLAAGRRKQVDPGGRLWRNVLSVTGQGPLKSINPA
jgi:6-phosphofructokinase 1